jgi:hypothetical protein
MRSSPCAPPDQKSAEDDVSSGTNRKTGAVIRAHYRCIVLRRAEEADE